MPRRFIAHLDMDAFYASVELLRYPHLRGKPVVVGGRRRVAADDSPDTSFPTLRNYTGRGVITTATYEARALGVHSGMGLMKAAKLAPAALLLPADFDEYRRYSRMFKAAVRALAPQVEDRGIDEIYIDLTDLVMSGQGSGADENWTRARSFAATIQRAVSDATALSCSIGISPNKLLSKIASDLHKPGGITVLRAQERINAVEGRMKTALEANDLEAVRQLIIETSAVFKTIKHRRMCAFLKPTGQEPGKE